MIKVPEYIESLKPYKSGNSLDKKLSKEEFDKLINLASNENPLGPSPKAIEFLNNTKFELNRYPNPASTDLIAKLAEKLGKAENQIIAGHGSDSLIQYIFNAFCEKGDEVLTCAATFIGTFVSANKFGLKLNLVKYNSNYGFDLNLINENITANTKVIYLANPNNPTGTMFTKQEFDEFMEKVPEDILVILDEAYWIYCLDNPNYPNGMDYNLPNLIVLRTLSKAYGLAGLRIGYAVGPANLINYLYRVKLPFEPHSLAQAAALKCLEDDSFIFKTVEENRKGLEIIIKALDNKKIKRTEAFANFTMLIFDSDSEAKNFVSNMLDNGIITRHLPMFGLPNCVRVSSGTIDQCKYFAEVLDKII